MVHGLVRARSFGNTDLQESEGARPDIGAFAAKWASFATCAFQLL